MATMLRRIDAGQDLELYGLLDVYRPSIHLTGTTPLQMEGF